MRVCSGTLNHTPAPVPAPRESTGNRHLPTSLSLAHKIAFRAVKKNEQEKRPRGNNSVEKKDWEMEQSGRIKKKKRASDRRVERRREKIDNKWVSKCYRLHVQPLLSVPVQWHSGSDAETWHCTGRRDFFSLVKSGWLSRGAMVLYRTTCYCPSISASKVWTNELPGVPLLLCPPHEKEFSFHILPFAVLFVFPLRSRQLVKTH